MEKISRKMQLIIFAALGILIFFGGARYYEMRLDSVRFEASLAVEEEETRVEQQAEDEALKLVSVHVVGAVEKSGVFTLAENKRVNDAVELAGVLPTADLSQINLALPLEDGKQIYVPAKGEKAAARSTFASAKQGDGNININTAGASELDRLPGIGPALAQRIIDYREKNGAFGSINDITKVSGIGPAMFEKLKDKIRVN